MASKIIYSAKKQNQTLRWPANSEIRKNNNLGFEGREGGLRATMIYPKKPGFNLYQSWHCAYNIQRENRVFKKSLCILS